MEYIIRFMVSRIESNGGGNWHFTRNVMPGEVVGVRDQLPDGGCIEYAVICKPDNAFTQVLKKTNEDEGYVQEAVLQLGSGYYLTDIYSPTQRERVDMRISHQTRF